MEIIHGDCLEVMKTMSDDSVDMVFTSPPYAERRKGTYGGIPEDEFVDWFEPIGSELKRIIKPTGSIFINIKPHTDKGERSLYVFDLVCMLKRKVGLMFVDEFCWTKNAFPGSFKGRLKNGFEPVYHFTKTKPSNITFNPLACGKPIDPETTARAYRKQCGAPENGSGMTGMNTTNLRHLKMGRPSNVVHVHNVSNQFSLKKEHPATFPEGLVEFFTKTFTNEGDVILDPFAGSGTTAVVAAKLNREFIMIELQEEYCDLIKRRVKSEAGQDLLFREIFNTTK